MFPLKISPNRRYLVDRNGKPFFVMGDTPWYLQKLPLADVRLIMDDRKARGYNTLFLELLDDSDIRSRDANGSVPFHPPLDITRPVEAYWRYADAVLEEAEKRGFFVIHNSIWYGAGEGLWMHHVKPEAMRLYGHFLGKRYARFQNLMWMHCGDRNPDENLAECARQIARAIKQEAPHHLQTAHLSPDFASAAFFHTDDWLDVNMAYTYGSASRHIVPEYQRKDPVRPVLFGETGYEGEPNAIELLPDARKGDLWDPYRIRRQVWWGALSGACGYCAGTRLWRYEPNWKEILGIRSIREAPLLARLYDTLEWQRLAPDLSNRLVKAGGGKNGEAHYVAAATADNGAFALAYLPAQKTVTVSLSALSGKRVRARWYDPTNGAFRDAVPGSIENSDDRAFTPPDRNSAGEPDFALLLEGLP
jgi:hypothetical protein